MPLLRDLTWPQLRSTRPTLLVPVGSVEQHGPPLPLDTDVRIAEAVAAGMLAAEPSLVVAPAVAYGAAGEHEGFPGTVSIGHDALRLLLVEYVRSACRWAGRLLFVDANGNGAAEAGEILRFTAAGGREPAATPSGITDRIAFESTGVASATGSVRLCDDRSGPHGRSVEWNAAGRVALRAANCP